MLKIVKANQPLPVKQITVTVYALPGIGKTSLAFSAGALLIDTDKGSYRSANRGDTVQPASWSEIANLTASDLEGYSAVALDTAGRALDLLTANLLENDPKLGRKSGDLSLQGFGALKSSFTSWLKRLHACGKDVILLSHMDEKMEGDITKERLDIQGGSKAEIYKSSDAMAKLYIDGKTRKLDFSPREGSLGKNPAQFDILTVPNFAVQPQFFAEVLADIKKALNKMSEAQTQVQDELQGWRTILAACKTAADFNSLLPQAAKADHAVKTLVMAVATEKGMRFNKEEREFYLPQKQAQSASGASEPPEQPQPSPEPPKPAVEPANAKESVSHEEPAKAVEQSPKSDVIIQEVFVTDVEQRTKDRKQYMLLTSKIEGSDNTLALICWHKNTMFDHLKRSIDKACTFGITRHEANDTFWYTIETIERIGEQVFENNQPVTVPAGKELFA